MKFIRISVWGLLLMASACSTVQSKSTSSKGRRPSWMDNPHQKYPLRYYISAVGEGDTLQDAQGVAVGNLAKVFKTDIKVDEVLQERYVELMGKQNSYQESTQFDRNVQIKAGMSLVNVQYPDSYTDDTGRVYALAVLNREKTAGVLATRLRENDDRIGTFLNQADGASPATAYAALSAAVAISIDSSLLLEQLDIISPATKKSVSLAHDCDVLAKQLAEAAAKVQFDVDVDNDSDGKIAASIEALITDMGFVVADGKNALRVMGDVTLEETDLKRQELVFVRYEVNLKVLTPDGTVVVSVSDRGREGHVSGKEAEARCIRSIVGLIDRTLRGDLIDYFDGLVVGKGNS